MTIRNYWRDNRGDLIMVAFFLIISAGLSQLTLFQAPANQTGVKVKSTVLSVDNRGIEPHGFVTVGFQDVKLKVIEGAYAGKEFVAKNNLRGRTDVDKMFVPGDIALAAIQFSPDGTVIQVNAQDHYRIGRELWLFAIFGLLLLVFCGWIGVKAILSFVFACLVIWKLVMPLCMLGYNPIIVSLLAVLLLAAAIIFLVAGLTAKGVTAFCGTVLGLLSSCVLGMIFTDSFRIDGAVMPYSQALFFAGFEYLRLTDIYIGAIFLASSGALMDLAMDVAAGMKEVAVQRPDIPRRELMFSGFRIGRLVVGTMTTTLLLAYSGGYLTMLMTFAAEGVGPVDFLNYPYVASEVLRTLVGSIGLLLVAPFTALVGSIILPAKPSLRL